ncbi:MAG: rod shape-determining protein [Bryobacterales bacterium]|nr:rod shape-determining protein [Bryobacterales bacterium]
MIGLAGTRVALDAGTANTLLYVKGRGVAVNEPSLVTVRTRDGGVESAGEEAYAGLGRTPLELETARPVRGGIVADLKLFEAMLERFFAKARVKTRTERMKVALAVPSGVTEVERMALLDSLKNAGAADVIEVHQVLAAARGAGLPIEESRGRMVVDIGAGVTEAAIVSLGDTVYVHSTRVAGDDLDTAIVAYVRAEHQLIIGERTAERVKMRIGGVLDRGDSGEPLKIKGRCLVNGLPREVTVTAGEVREAVAATVQRILRLVRDVLEKAPPELSADLVETGIVLTGGTAQLRHLDELITADCGLPVITASEPQSAVIAGLAHQLEHLRPSDWRRFGVRR